MSFTKSLAIKLCRLSEKCYSCLTYKTGTDGFLLEVQGNTQYLAFPGSYELKDWITDTEFIKVNRKDMGSLHNGFSDAWGLLKDEVVKRLDKNKKLILTGHSYGGAIATIAALSLHNKGFKIDALYTYGSPRVGNLEWKKYFEKSGIKHYRIKNGKDFVTTIPKILFFHVGEEIILNPRSWFVPFSFLDHKIENYLENLEKI